MNKTIRLITLILLLASTMGSQGIALGDQMLITWQNKVDASVLENAALGDTEFLVFMQEQADLSAAANLKTKLEKGTYVYQELTRVSKRTQRNILDRLAASGVEHQSFWIANMIWVRGSLDLVQEMARRTDVAHIYDNPKIYADLPKPSPISLLEQEPEVVTAVEWNIIKVNAPQVWAAGYTGQGAVVAGADTGYDWDHPALKNQYRGWNSGVANHNYNWHDAIHSGGGLCGPDSPVPCDDFGHGTHTMGTMVGDDGGSNQIGVAPGARWIGCRNMNFGAGTPTTYSECFQFFIAPTDLSNNNPRPDLAPDVINNSWGCTSGEGCAGDTLLTVVNNTKAAGIVVVVSTGNDGPQCGTVYDPPATYGAAFSVGATDSSDMITSFSSRGPASYTGLLKPNISAPGYNIRSSIPGGLYAGGFVWSGTSMAAPHVAGTVALMISAQPPLAGQTDKLQTLIEHSALPRTSDQDCGGVDSHLIPNNIYGWGRVDAYAALNSIQPTFTIEKTASTTLAVPDQPLTYTLAITYFHPLNPTNSIVLTDVIPLNTTFMDATPAYTLQNGMVRWNFPSMSNGQSQIAKLTVRVEPAGVDTITNQSYGVKSNNVAAILGIPLPISFARYMEILPMIFKQFP